MIVPTTILSLAALSAAESNSSGKRGLRKSSTPWTAILVVSGTAVVGLGAGFGLGYLMKSVGGGAAGDGSCDDYSLTAGIVGVCTGCAKDYYEVTARRCRRCFSDFDSLPVTAGPSTWLTAKNATNPSELFANVFTATETAASVATCIEPADCANNTGEVFNPPLLAYEFCLCKHTTTASKTVCRSGHVSCTDGACASAPPSGNR